MPTTTRKSKSTVSQCGSPLLQGSQQGVQQLGAQSHSGVLSPGTLLYSQGIPGSTQGIPGSTITSSHTQLDPATVQLLINALNPGIQAAVQTCIQSTLQSALVPLLEKLELQTKEIAAIKDENNVLKNRIEALEAYSKRDNLIFNGINIQSYADAASATINFNQDTLLTPTTSDVSVENVVIALCVNKLGINIDSKDIVAAHRLGRQHRSNSSAAQSNANRDNISAIIVKFASRRVRDAIYAAKRKLKDSDKKIYINEHLTEGRSKIFRSARALVKSKHIHAAWTFNGSVFIKESVNSRAIVVQDLNNLPVINQSG